MDQFPSGSSQRYRQTGHPHRRHWPGPGKERYTPPDEGTEQRDRPATMKKANVSSSVRDMGVTAVVMVVTRALPRGR